MIDLTRAHHLMSDPWPTVRIGDVAELFDSPHQTAPLDSTGPVTYLNVADIHNGRIQLRKSGTVSEATAQAWSRRVTPRPGDLVFGYEAKVGHAAVLPEGRWCLGRRVGLLRPDPRHADGRFLAYTWHSRPFQELLAANRISGSTIESIRLTDLPNWRMALPNLQEQRAIADVLGALDDKVESNRRMVETSRDLARLELQHASAGGKLVRMGDIATVERGLAYTSAGLTGEGIPMIGLANAENFGWLKRSGLKPYSGPYKDRHVVPAGSLLVTSVEQTWSNEILGWPMLVPDDLAGSLFTQDLYAVRFRDEESWRTLPVWAAMFTRDSRAWLEGHVYGSTVARIPREAIEGLCVACPSRDSPTISLAEQLLRRAWAAELESRTLAALRDALLPELLSGRLRVPEAREQVEALV